jgi:hypothetical protein
VTTIRPERAGDADFIARAIMIAQRGPYPRSRSFAVAG